jgi:hypothetical protein
MAESYMSKWDAIVNDNEGKTLREEVFAKYGLDASNEKIKSYTTQIDKIEEELDNLVNRQ